jgi:hypothetical protein
MAAQAAEGLDKLKSMSSALHLRCRLQTNHSISPEVSEPTKGANGHSKGASNGAANGEIDPDDSDDKEDEAAPDGGATGGKAGHTFWIW